MRHLQSELGHKYPTCCLESIFCPHCKKLESWIGHSVDEPIVRPMSWNIRERKDYKNRWPWEVHAGACWNVMTKRWAIHAGSGMSWGFPESGKDWVKSKIEILNCFGKVA